LKDVGALPYVETAWTVSMKYSARGFVWAENNLPVYYSKTRVVLEPYVDMSKDLGIIAWNGAGKVWNNTKEIVSTKTPIVTDFVGFTF
jgi:TMEM214, C-terminal, caspase 4 activator